MPPDPVKAYTMNLNSTSALVYVRPYRPAAWEINELFDLILFGISLIVIPTSLFINYQQMTLILPHIFALLKLRFQIKPLTVQRVKTLEPTHLPSLLKRPGKLSATIKPMGSFIVAAAFYYPKFFSSFCHLLLKDVQKSTRCGHRRCSSPIDVTSWRHIKLFMSSSMCVTLWRHVA